MSLDIYLQRVTSARAVNIANANLAGGQVISVGAQLLSTSASASVWLIVCDAAAAPSNGALPALVCPPIRVVAGQMTEYSLGGYRLTNGLAIVASTTDANITAIVSSDVIFTYLMG